MDENQELENAHFENRMEAEGEAEVNKTSLMIYGVDFMSTDNVRDYFQNRKIEIEWINDS